jgi:predicted nucleotidyltransferase
MKAVGLIVEYNPFHNGHYYHLHQSKKQTGADVTIAAMSGSFLQRGEPALVSKWKRTKMALLAGADIVIELPYAFSTGKAEIFANGAVSLLTALKADHVCFGSEEGNIASFLRTISFLETHQNQYDSALKRYLAEGCSFPKASSLAFQTLQGNERFLDLSKPNNILGYHYVKAIRDQNSSMEATTIQRSGSGYHDPDFGNGTIASATSIRKAIIDEEKPLDTIEAFVPDFVNQELKKARKEHGGFHSWERLYPFLQYRLLSSPASELKNIYEAEEGLENRLIQSVKKAETFTEFMNEIKTKRYTWTRLQRFCVHLLMNTTKRDMMPVIKKPEATYIRLLGMSEKGQTYLNGIKKELDIPLISTLSQHDDPLLTLDIKAADCYALGYLPAVRFGKLDEEYASPPIRLYENDR